MGHYSEYYEEDAREARLREKESMQKCSRDTLDILKDAKHKLDVYGTHVPFREMMSQDLDVMITLLKYNLV